MSKKKTTGWSRNRKKRGGRQTEQENQISELLDQADAQELLQISAIHSHVALPLPNQEKLAWSVIDKADLADEEELARRREFQRKLRRQKMIRLLIGCGAAVLILVVLALCGVFDRIRLPYYETYYVVSGRSFMGAEPEITMPEGAVAGIPSLEQEPYVNGDKLDTTVYYALAEYCSRNQYAVGEYTVTKEGYYRINGKQYLSCTVLAQCQDYQKEDQGKTWKDLGYRDDEVEATASASAEDADTEGSGLIPLNVNAPINVYPVLLHLMVCIQ